MPKDKGVVKRAIVTPDKHFPLADMPAIRRCWRMEWSISLEVEEKEKTST